LAETGFVHAGESFDEAFRARLAKAPLHRRLAFTDGGLTLGAGAVVAKMATDARGRSVGLALEGEEESILVRFAAAFGKAVSPHVLSNLSRTSEHWSRGDRCLAHIHLAHAGLPAIDEAGALRLALCEEAPALGCTPSAIYKALDLEPPPSTHKFDADQPRVPAGSGRESGRWTSGAGGGGGGAAVREGRSVSPHEGGGENSEQDKLEDFKAKLGEETDEKAGERGRPPTDLDAPSVPVPGQAAAPSSGLPSKYELLGNNPRFGRSRRKTDLPGGKEEAKTWFERLIEGQPTRRIEDQVGNSRTSTDDEKLHLRVKSNGEARIDREVDIGGRKRETIHFNDRKTP